MFHDFNVQVVFNGTYLKSIAVFSVTTSFARGISAMTIGPIGTDQICSSYFIFGFFFLHLSICL